MDFVQALVQELGAIESKAKVLSNPGSCPTCNDCEGWEGKTTKSRGNTLVLNKWPTAPFRLETSVKNLESSADSGCTTCGVFRDVIAHFRPTLECNLEVEAWLPMRGLLPQLKIKMEYSVEDGPNGIRNQFELFTAPDAPSPWRLSRPGKLFPEDTSSNASLQQALKWLQDCSKNHPQCSIFSKSESKLPTRVLDIGISDSPTEPVKLHETNGQAGRYIALSHCWGKSQMIKTENRSFEQHKQEISWNTLPRTFQDAITFTRRLHVRYIWIDSLCIIQDDSADWERESAQMASIYANSFLTIVAAKAANSTEGCFAIIPETEHTHMITGVDAKTGAPFTIYARPAIRHADDTEGEKLFPISSRAWCYQEQVLSPRLLHFHYCELKWECMEKTSCECSLADGIPHDKKEHSKALTQGSDIHSLNDRWRRMVRSYVELSLTYESDRLPALSGVAKQMGSVRKGRYLAGLWEDSLCEDLMWWVTESDMPQVRRPKEWRAPSWSWASIEGRIMHRIYPMKTIHCTINEVEIIPAGQDPTGAVASGRLVVSGILMLAKLRHVSPTLDAEELEGEERHFEIEIVEKKLVHKIYADYPLDSEGPSYVPDGQDVYCLCIATDQWHTCWLVLRKVRDIKEELYERIGMANEKPAKGKEHDGWPGATGEKSVVIIV